MNIGYEQKRFGASWIRREKIEENGNWSSGFSFFVPFFLEALNMEKKIVEIVERWQGTQVKMQERGGVVEGGKKNHQSLFKKF